MSDAACLECGIGGGRYVTHLCTPPADHPARTERDVTEPTLCGDCEGLYDGDPKNPLCPFCGGTGGLRP